MAQAKYDQDYVPVGLGINNTDTTTPLMLRVDPVTNYVLVDVTGATISATPASMDKRDQNYQPTMYGVSSADSTVLLPIRTDSLGRILVDIA